MANADDLLGWKDILTCPFCSGVAVEGIRLPQTEPAQDCGVGACAECARAVLRRDIRHTADEDNLPCPRCEQPISVIQLKAACKQINHRDPLAARLLADVVAHCPYCDMTGMVSTVTNHTA